MNHAPFAAQVAALALQIAVIGACVPQPPKSSERASNDPRPTSLAADLAISRIHPDLLVFADLVTSVEYVTPVPRQPDDGPAVVIIRPAGAWPSTLAPPRQILSLREVSPPAPGSREFVVETPLGPVGVIEIGALEFGAAWMSFRDNRGEFSAEGPLSLEPGDPRPAVDQCRVLAAGARELDGLAAIAAALAQLNPPEHVAVHLDARAMSPSDPATTLVRQDVFRNQRGVVTVMKIFADGRTTVERFADQ